MISTEDCGVVQGLASLCYTKTSGETGNTILDTLLHHRTTHTTMSASITLCYSLLNIFKLLNPRPFYVNFIDKDKYYRSFLPKQQRSGFHSINFNPNLKFINNLLKTDNCKVLTQISTPQLVCSRQTTIVTLLMYILHTSLHTINQESSGVFIIVITYFLISRLIR